MCLAHSSPYLSLKYRQKFSDFQVERRPFLSREFVLCPQLFRFEEANCLQILPTRKRYPAQRTGAMRDLRFVIMSEFGRRGSTIHTLADEKLHVVTAMGHGRAAAR
jgi:hypothetical protein